MRFIESQNAWEKAFGESGQAEAEALDADLIVNAFEKALSHTGSSSDTALSFQRSNRNETNADYVHFDAQRSHASGKHSDSELSLARSEIPKAISIVVTSSTHRSCEASLGSQTSGKQLAGNLSLVPDEGENVGSGSNHDLHEASPVALVLTDTSRMHQADQGFLSDPTIANAGGMHLHDEVFLGCSGRALDSVNPSGIQLQCELSPAADPSPLALDTSLTTSMNTDVTTSPWQPNRHFRRKQSIREPVRRSERIQKKPKDVRNYEILRKVQQMHVEDCLIREAANNVFVATYTPLLEGQ